MHNWDLRFLRLAEHVSLWSKDPSTKCGAVIVDNDNRIVSMGYNGLAKGLSDDPSLLQDREQKIKQIIHADMNAILFARQSLRSCIIYTHPFIPCSHCAAVIVQVGISRVVSPLISHTGDLWARWDCDTSVRILGEGGVKLDELNHFHLEAKPKPKHGLSLK